MGRILLNGTGGRSVQSAWQTGFLFSVCECVGRMMLEMDSPLVSGDSCQQLSKKYQRTTTRVYKSSPLRSLWHRRVWIVPINCSMLNLSNERVQHFRAIGIALLPQVVPIPSTALVEAFYTRSGTNQLASKLSARLFWYWLFC